MVNAIAIDVDGIEQVEHRLLSLSVRSDNAQPALKAIALMLRRREAELFETAGSSGGDPWEDLAASTQARKEAAGFPPAILIATSDLEASLTEEGGDHVEFISDDELIFGTSDPKARFHQDGTSRMPARPVVQMDRQTQREAVREVQRFLVGADVAAMAGVW